MDYYIAALGITELIITAFVFLLPTLLWIWAIIDCAKRNFTTTNDKMIWLVVIVLLPLIGSIIYVINGRHQGTLPTQENR